MLPEHSRLWAPDSGPFIGETSSGVYSPSYKWHIHRIDSQGVQRPVLDTYEHSEGSRDQGLNSRASVTTTPRDTAGRYPGGQ